MSVLPGDVKHLIAPPPQSSDTSVSSEEQPHGNVETVEAVLSILSPLIEDDINGSANGVGRRKKKSTKGWDGEAVVVAGEGANIADDHEGMLLPVYVSNPSR